MIHFILGLFAVDWGRMKNVIILKKLGVASSNCTVSFLNNSFRIREIFIDTDVFTGRELLLNQRIHLERKNCSRIKLVGFRSNGWKLKIGS